MANQKLVEYIKLYLERGYDRKELVKYLHGQGHDYNTIHEALKTVDSIKSTIKGANIGTVGNIRTKPKEVINTATPDIDKAYSKQAEVRHQEIVEPRESEAAAIIQPRMGKEVAVETVKETDEPVVRKFKVDKGRVEEEEVDGKKKKKKEASSLFGKIGKKKVEDDESDEEQIERKLISADKQAVREQTKKLSNVSGGMRYAYIGLLVVFVVVLVITISGRFKGTAEPGAVPEDDGPVDDTPIDIRDTEDDPMKVEAKGFGIEVIQTYFTNDLDTYYDMLDNTMFSIETDESIEKTPALKEGMSGLFNDIVGEGIDFQLYFDSYDVKIWNKEEFTTKFDLFDNLQNYVPTENDYFFDSSTLKPGMQEIMDKEFLIFILRKTSDGWKIIGG